MGQNKAKHVRDILLHHQSGALKKYFCKFPSTNSVAWKGEVPGSFRKQYLTLESYHYCSVHCTLVLMHTVTQVSKWQLFPTIRRAPHGEPRWLDGDGGGSGGILVTHWQTAENLWSHASIQKTTRCVQLANILVYHTWGQTYNKVRNCPGITIWNPFCLFVFLA